MAMLSEVGGEGGDAAEPGVLELMTDLFGQGRGNGTPQSPLTSVRGGAGRVSTSIDDATHAAALVRNRVTLPTLLPVWRGSLARRNAAGWGSRGESALHPRCFAPHSTA
jgi:hypothetical protein